MAIERSSAKAVPIDEPGNSRGFFSAAHVAAQAEGVRVRPRGGKAGARADESDGSLCARGYAAPP
jgi:hypothetical protein